MRVLPGIGPVAANTCGCCHVCLTRRSTGLPQLNPPIQRRLGTQRKTLHPPPPFILVAQKMPLKPWPRITGKMRGPTGNLTLPLLLHHRRHQKAQANLLIWGPLLVCLTEYLPHWTIKKALLDRSPVQKSLFQVERPTAVGPLNPMGWLPISRMLQSRIPVQEGNWTLAREGRSHWEHGVRQGKTKYRVKRRPHLMRAAWGEEFSV